MIGPIWVSDRKTRAYLYADNIFLNKLVKVIKHGALHEDKVVYHIFRTFLRYFFVSIEKGVIKYDF